MPRILCTLVFTHFQNGCFNHNSELTKLRRMPVSSRKCVFTPFHDRVMQNQLQKLPEGVIYQRWCHVTVGWHSWLRIHRFGSLRQLASALDEDCCELFQFQKLAAHWKMTLLTWSLTSSQLRAICDLACDCLFSKLCDFTSQKLRVWTFSLKVYEHQQFLKLFIESQPFRHEKESLHGKQANIGASDGRKQWMDFRAEVGVHETKANSHSAMTKRAAVNKL